MKIIKRLFRKLFPRKGKIVPFTDTSENLLLMLQSYCRQNGYRGSLTDQRSMTAFMKADLTNYIKHISTELKNENKNL